MSTDVDCVKIRCDTKFEADTFFNFPDDYDDQYLQKTLSAHTHQDDNESAETPSSNEFLLSNPANVDATRTQLDTSDAPPGFDDIMVKRKSDLLVCIGRFRAKHPDKVTLQEYMMHAYVIVHTKNPHTILTYEIIMTHSSLDPAQFSRVLYTQTLSRLEQEGFQTDAADLLNPRIQHDKEIVQMDRQISCLWQCYFSDLDEQDEVMTELNTVTPCRTSDGTPRSRDDNVDEPQAIENSGNLSFSDLMQVTELSKDVVYEALRLHGNRLVQRSVYGETRRLYGGNVAIGGQEAVAKASSTSEDLRSFVENIQKYSVDISSDVHHIGQERRMSTRQYNLLRKKLM
ncbi:hypothetical protein BgAZ_300080 [Babesia gibsoni]|uniref:Uncharacterized protein n=1 Tax=Babesia gibsoni TaxID=33632 RepID=A0AAD8LH03_BABGI|nr:hypothetical protein BgAZ_300080 [Babesia gibsoni]